MAGAGAVDLGVQGGPGGAQRQRRQASAAGLSPVRDKASLSSFPVCQVHSGVS